MLAGRNWGPGRSFLLWLAFIIALPLLAGCGGGDSQRPKQLSSPGASHPQLNARAKDVLFTALELVGTPYRYGGNTPQGGFDCSGLVGYVYRQAANLNLPRSTAEIAQARGKGIGWGQLLSGDLVMFGAGRVDHVGIYVGEGRFVHAPSSGGTVRLDRLQDSYWTQRFKGGKRLL